MTLYLKTVSGEDLTVSFIDPEFIQIGRLPLLSIAQFANYASLILAEKIIPKLEAVTRADLAVETAQMLRRTSSLPILPAESQGTCYDENPFVMPPGRRNVDLVYADETYYTVAPDSFLHMTYRTLGYYIVASTGVARTFLSNPPEGIPQEVRDGVACIHEAL